MAAGGDRELPARRCFSGGVAVGGRQRVSLNMLSAARFYRVGFSNASRGGGLLFAFIPDDVGAAFSGKNEIFPAVVVEVCHAYL